jgi:hypothetical protein
MYRDGDLLDPDTNEEWTPEEALQSAYEHEKVWVKMRRYVK